MRRDEESMFRWLVEIRCHARTKLDRVMAYELEIGELVAQHKLQEAVKLGVIVLKDLGVSFPRQPFRLQILLSFVQVKLGLLRTPIDSLVDLPEVTDAMLCAQVRIMRRIAKPAYMSFPDLAPLITFKQMHLLLRYGHTPFSPSILGSMGLLLCGAVGDLDTGYRLGLVALRLLEKSPNNPHKGRTVYLFNHFVRHWKEHLNTTLGSIQEAYRLCLEAGDLEWASNAGVAYCQHLFLSGAELDACARECTIYSQAIRAFKEESMLATNEIIRQTVLIIIRFQVETNYPRPGGQTSQSLGVIRQTRKPGMKLCKHSGHGVENAIRELLFPEFIPDMFLGVEFRRVAR